MPENCVSIAGAGLAGCEAALWLAEKGVNVKLFEQKPYYFSPAHKSGGLAELVCSNSFKAERSESAAGTLKEEMRAMGSSLLKAADKSRVPAGGALSVDRDMFSSLVEEMVTAHPNINLIRCLLEDIPEGPLIIATGPLTDGAFADAISSLCGGDMLNFYDAAAPIVTGESIDMDEVFAASRYGRGEADYLNCPFDKEGYEAFYEALINAESAELSEADKSVPSSEQSGKIKVYEGCDAVRHTAGEQSGKIKVYEGCDAVRHTAGEQSGKIKVYEGCMPVEIMAKRGQDTLRFGPLKPVGLTNPKTGHRPWANVQLRKENAEGSLYNLVGFQTNLRFGEQKRVFSMIPGLKNAEFARYGVMHRNSFLNSPAILNENLSVKGRENLFFAGQITGFEGYMESAASGLLAARAVYCLLKGEGYTPPPAYTMCGALLRYITTENKDFQPMGANLGILPPLDTQIRDKRQRAAEMNKRALAGIEEWNRKYSV